MASKISPSAPVNLLTLEDIVGQAVNFVHHCKSKRFTGETDCLQMSSGAELYPINGKAMYPWGLTLEELDKRLVWRHLTSYEYVTEGKTESKGESKGESKKYIILRFIDADEGKRIYEVPDVQVTVPKLTLPEYDVGSLETRTDEIGLAFTTWSTPPDGDLIFNFSKQKDLLGFIILKQGVGQFEIIPHGRGGVLTIRTTPATGRLTLPSGVNRFLVIGVLDLIDHGRRGHSVEVAIPPNRYRYLNITMSNNGKFTVRAS